MIALLILALALAADAFAVALVRGAGGQHRLRLAVETGFAFGIAQGVMPLAGWAVGTLFMQWIEAVDHWIAFVLLSFLGIRMLWEALSPDGEDPGTGAARTDSRSYWMALFAAAVATSIDAAAAGLTLDLFTVPVWLSCLVIGAVTAALCIPAYWFAARIGSRFGHVAEALGGVVLIGLGIKILLEHTQLI